MNTNKFSKSQKRFEELISDRKSCLWQIIPKEHNFMLEAWLMENNKVHIFQFFSDGRGFKEYVDAD